MGYNFSGSCLLHLFTIYCSLVVTRSSQGVDHLRPLEEVEGRCFSTLQPALQRYRRYSGELAVMFILT